MAKLIKCVSSHVGQGGNSFKNGFIIVVIESGDKVNVVIIGNEDSDVK